jgi:myb proto-oncogene protein
VGLPPSAVDIDEANANADPVTDTQPNVRPSTRATGSWTSDEDAKLTSAVKNTSKKKHGKEYKTDWVTISALVPGRTRKQCTKRWCAFLRYSIDGANRRMGTWTEDEDSKLKDAVETHGRKNWKTIAALVPGRTRDQCGGRWKDILDRSIGRDSGRLSNWTAVEDCKLRDALQTHGGKNWAAIAALIPGRSEVQCRKRWHKALNPSIALTAGRGGKWTADEDIKLKDAVQTHGGKNWAAFSALVTGRTRQQCGSRWHDTLNPSIALTAGRGGKWSEDEVITLKDAYKRTATRIGV